MKTFRSHLEEKRCWPGYKPAPGKEAYSKDSCVKEESEQLDEISKETLTSYMSKNKENQSKLSKDFAAGDRSKERAQKMANRGKGYLNAGVKLQKKAHTEYHAAKDASGANVGPKPKPETPEQRYKRENPNTARPYWGEDVECNGTGEDKECPVHGMKNCENLKEDWQKVNKADKTDGLSQKAVDAYRRENPGSKLKTAVTKDPSKLKAGSKDAKRRLSFCRRMRGMKNRLTNPENARDPDSPVNKALRRWNC